MRSLTVALAAGAVAFSTIAMLHRPAQAATPVQLADKGDKASKDVSNDAREVIAKAIDHAAAGDLQSLLKENVGSHDRERISKDLKDEAKYKEAADKFRGAWKKKYGSDFGAAEHSRFANAFAVDSGKDENHADVKIEGSGVKEPLYLHVHKEKSGEWVIALPDSLSGESFSSNMTEQMQKLADEKDWPNSVDEGYRHAAAQILRPLQYKAK